MRAAALKFLSFLIIITGANYFHFRAFCQNPAEANHQFKFKQVGFQEGLSNLQIREICQDELGYIWIATARGVNRFDGRDMKQFLFSAEDEQGLSHNFIHALNSGEHGVFISTNKALHYYNNRNEKMSRIGSAQWEKNNCSWRGRFFSNLRYPDIVYYDENELKIKIARKLEDSPGVEYLFSDDEYGIWALNSNDHLFFLDPVSFEYSFQLDLENLLEKNIRWVNDIKRINDFLWIATNSGLIIYDLNEKEPLTKIDNSFPVMLRDKDIRFIVKDSNNNILVGTYDSGLFIFDQQGNIIHNLNAEGNSGLTSNNLTGCFIDKDNNIWIGTFNKGVFVHYDNLKEFNPHVFLNEVTQGKYINHITSEGKKYYFGTRYDGLILLNDESNNIKNYTTENSDLALDHVSGTYIDSDGKVWIGLPNMLQLFNPATSEFRTLEIPENVGEVFSITEFTDGKVYACSASGFLVYEKNGTFLKMVTDCGPNVRQIIPYNDTSLLICTHFIGIFIYNPENENIHELIPDKEYAQWKEKDFCTVFMDRDSVLWVGNFNWGLFRYELKSNEMKIYNTINGLPSDDVYGLIEDPSGDLWISTSYGLSLFDKENGFINYFYSEGVNNQQFVQKSVHMDQNGLILFGGNEGLTHFWPEKIKISDPKVPDIKLETLNINYEPVLPGEDGILTHSLAYTNSIILDYSQRSISLDYLAFDYSGNDKISYSYMLEGFDKDWVNAGKIDRAVYSNLFPGNYTFKVRARNNGSEYSQAAILDIRVKQTPWLSTWAIAIYFTFFSGIVILIFRLSLNAKLLRKEKQIEHAERLRENEVYNMKLKFFTNISHELRTPLSVISGVIYLLSTQITLSGYAKELYQSLNQNVDRLLRLINQLLTFRELESDTLVLSVSKGSVKEHVRNICNTFRYYAQLKEITLINNFTFSKEFLYYDHDKFEKILSNLISNAIKYTPVQGEVSIHSEIITAKDAISKYGKNIKPDFPVSSSGYLEIIVKDNGKGIDEKYLEAIFDRYKRLENDNKKDYSGAGIGLNFVKRLINIHKGQIRATSKFKEGSVFSFILPLSKEIYSFDEFNNSLDEGTVITYSDISELPAEMANKNTVATKHEDYKIAVIEDNIELCKMIVNTLSSRFQVCYAHNGRTGYDLIAEEEPQLIISDIMMPELDGISLCEKVKKNDDLRHITFILLSAKSETHDQIEGIRRGADLYIPKPFNLEYLITVVDRQYENYRKIHESFRKGLFPDLDKKEVNKESMDFLSSLNLIIEEEIANPDFGLEEIAQKMNMGRTNFYKKFERITGVTPNKYITKYRINKSIELYRINNYNLSELSYLVGFRNASYYSTIFKKEKGLSPRDYLVRKKKEEDMD